MKLETEKLLIMPLTAAQLKLLVTDLTQLESELDCKYDAEPLVCPFSDIVKAQLEITQSDSENYCWHSFWLIIRKTDRTVVGSAVFKDVPNENGDVEIGYGLGKKYEHCGYMTQTVAAMGKWAKCHNNVKHVIAETPADGFASQKVLQRCGFVKYSCGETYWWKN